MTVEQFNIQLNNTYGPDITYKEVEEETMITHGLKYRVCYVFYDDTNPMGIIAEATLKKLKPNTTELRKIMKEMMQRDLNHMYI
jgi:hypothetical protein